METAVQLQRQIAANSQRLETLQLRLGTLARGDAQRRLVENEIHRILRAQDVWWDKLTRARGVTHYDLPQDRILGYLPESAKSATPTRQPPNGASDTGGTSTVPHGTSVSLEDSIEFGPISAGFYYISGKITVTGTVSLKPRNANEHLTSQSTKDGVEATLLMDSVLGAASGSLSYDHATGLFDASVNTSLKVGSVNVGFGGSLSCTGTPQFPAFTVEASPQPVKGTIGEYDVEGSIGMKIEATVHSKFPPPPPVPVLRPVPRVRPPRPFYLPPFHVPVFAPFVIDNFFDWFRRVENGGEDPPQS